MIRRHWFAIAIGLIVAGGAILRAQDTPTIFIHGLASSSATWQDAASRLSSALSISPVTPDLSWSDTYENQAFSLQANPSYSGLPGSTVAIGHSNGGVVAREWSKSHSLAALITLGSPNQGAPVITNIGLFEQYNQEAIVSVINASGDLSWLLTRGPEDDEYCCDFDWMWAQVSNIASIVTSFMNFGIRGIIADIGINIGAPVLGEMQPLSSYLQGLNGSDNVNREIAAIPTRVAIVSSASRYGGLFRVAFGNEDTGNTIGDVMHGGAVTLWSVASELSFDLDPDDWDGWTAVDDLYVAGDWLWSFDDLWCQAVTVPGMSYCDENDDVVPISNQYYQAATLIYTGYEAGPIHVLETTNAYDWLYTALANDAQIPPRSGGGGGGSGGGGGEPPPGPNALAANQGLTGDQDVWSESGQYVFYYQADGNLVLYAVGDAGWDALWASSTAGTSVGECLMQGDGNLVIYDADGNPVWSSNTWGHPGAILVVQDDGNVVIYDVDGSVLWATGTNR